MRSLVCLSLYFLLSSALAQEPPAPTEPAPLPPPVSVEVDGRPVEFKTMPPKAIGGRLLVPLRGIFEEMGAYVEFDQAARRVIARMGNEEIELRIGDRVARKNGAEIMMDIEPRIVEGTVMVPLRFIAESMNAKVEYSKAENKVRITTVSFEPEEEPGER